VDRNLPNPNRKTQEIAKIILKEIISQFGLPMLLQSDNDTYSISQVTQQLSKALGINYHVNISWHTQSSGNGKV
jgi:hypothetical protein